MSCLWSPLPWMRWRPPRFIVCGMRQLRGLFQPRETQALQLPTFHWAMNHLNHCFHRRHCVSGSRKHYFLHCSSDIQQQDHNRLYLRLSNTVTYCDPEHSSLAIGPGQVYMPHKPSWGEFEVHMLYNDWVANQFRGASFDSQWLKL